MTDKVCMWHLQETRWGKKPTSVVIHTLCVEVNKYEFCMIDYTVNALDDYKHEWTNENIAKAIDYCKPILKVMGVKGNLEIKGVEFPKTQLKIN
jgi:hypothetical protein